MGKGKSRYNPLLKSVKSIVDGVIDRADKIASIATNAGVAYIGFNALKHPTGALVGLLALRLAQSPNLASGAAGIAALTGLGALNMVPPPEPLPGHRGVDWVLNELQKRGLWSPSIPISERPEEQIKIRTTGDFYLEP